MAASSQTRSASTSSPDSHENSTEKNSVQVDVQTRHLLRLDVLNQDILSAKEPVAVVGRYVNTPADGAMYFFNQELKGWLQTGINRGIISSLLGELAFVPIPEYAKNKIGSNLLIIGGMGEFGRFTRDDLGYLMCNVTLSVTQLGYDSFATVLIGTGSQGILAERSARSITLGILNAFTQMGDLRESKKNELNVCFYVRDAKTEQAVRAELSRIEKELKSCNPTNHNQNIQIEIKPKSKNLRARSDSNKIESNDRRINPNRVTITCSNTSPALSKDAPQLKTLEYAALTSSAVVPAREQFVQRYFLDKLPERLRDCNLVKDQKRLGEILSSYLIPADLHPLIHGEGTLTLVLDSTTAAIPWEMASAKQLGMDHQFYGTSQKLTRQFRTTQTVAPGIPPLLNKRLDILIIADPAKGPLALLGARQEARAVLEALQTASAEKITIRATVRIGPPGTPQEELNKITDGISSKILCGTAAPCEPLDVLGLMLNESFDVIHFAGHGVFNSDTNRIGWVFDDDCLLTATEILKLSKVPRLVFANACHSAAITPNPAYKNSAEHMIGMAEAFFSQGVENYLGTGWEVDDTLASLFAKTFYLNALGAENKPPMELASAAAEARNTLLNKEPDENKTWGAYQYYGQPEARLIE